MPKGLKFQRKHRIIGYRLKYLYYFIARRDILQKKKIYGNKNQNKVIYVVKPDFQDGVEGLLSLIYREVLYIEYAKGKGYIPFVDWKNYKTQYYDGENNVWNYFFRQPSTMSEVDVYSSKNVILSGWTFKNINPMGLFESNIFNNNIIRSYSHDILCSNLYFSDEILELVDNEMQLLNIDNLIGVYIRGTDYIKLKPSGEYIQPCVRDVQKVMSLFLKKYNTSFFLVTEDGDIYDELVECFGDFIKIVSYDTFIRNYDGNNVLSKSGVLNENKKQRGQQYLVKMILLSKCKYLISSITQGSKFSYILNGGKYEDEYIFDLGLY